MSYQAQLRLPRSALCFAVALASGLVSGQPRPLDNISPSTLIASGHTLLNQRRLIEASKEFRSAAHLAESFGDGVTAVEAFDALGATYSLLGRDEDAEAAYRLSIGLSEKYKLGATASRAALSALYVKWGRYRRAELVVTAGLATVSPTSPRGVQDEALLFGLLGSIETHLHNLLAAESHCRQALRVLENNGLAQSREWLLGANYLASTLIQSGRLEEAADWLQRAQLVGAKTLTGLYDGLTSAQIDMNLAKVDFTLKKFEDTERHLCKALAVYESLLGENHPNTGNTLLAYATLCRATRRKAEAKDFEARARKCFAANPAATAINHAVDVLELEAASHPSRK